MTPTADQLAQCEFATTPARRFPITPRLVSEFAPNASGVEVAMAQYGGVTFVAIKPTADTDVTTSLTAEELAALPENEFAGVPETFVLSAEDEQTLPDFPDETADGYPSIPDVDDEVDRTTDEDYAAWVAAA